MSSDGVGRSCGDSRELRASPAAAGPGLQEVRQRLCSYSWFLSPPGFFTTGLTEIVYYVFTMFYNSFCHLHLGNCHGFPLVHPGHPAGVQHAKIVQSL